MPSKPTIGIVTAIPVEYAAMSALVDNGAREFPDDDHSTYLSGTMPSAQAGNAHAVVVTMLTRAGNDIAATAATNLIRTYPGVSLVIMCGIAAGVPSSDARKHVALGDLVVATKGIVDYDHVYVHEDRVRLRDGIPRPSPILTDAANLLHAESMLGDRPWEAWLDPASRGLPAEFRRPADPPSPAASTRRPGRLGVHYGRIGSADRSLRSATFVAALAAEHDLRAIEMEGKGIGNSAFLGGLGWFVVRGVSDHGDKDTNHAWRPAAALAAAAYTRALLGVCRPVAPRATAAKPTPPPAPVEVTGVAYLQPSIHIGDIRNEAAGHD